MGYKWLQVRHEGEWVDLISVLGPKFETARMHIERKLGERTRWRPEPDTPEKEIS